MAYKYKAFISYRHRDTDKFVALKIQKLLENFKMKGIEPWKLFRDEAELPTSSNLSDDIENALRQSEFLIVICTPELKESRWCMREITTFKELHGGSTDHILPVLVEGDPDEAFPYPLKTTLKLVKDPITGEQVKREVEIEPLAANVSGSTQSEINKKLKVEYLRLAATMSGRGFDDLYNRKRRQQIQRTSLLVGIVVFAAIAFGAYNFYMNLQLEKKNQQISEQLIKTRIANAEALNGQAEALYENGRIRDAIETMLSAYELNGEKTSMIPESDLILASEIGAYSAENVLPCIRLPHKMDVKDFYFRSNGHRLVTIDSKENVYLWNADNGELVKQWKSVENGLNKVNCLIQESHSVDSTMSLQYLLNGTIYGYNSNAAGMVMEGYRPMDIKSEVPVEEDDSFILFNTKRMWIVDAKTGKEIQIRIEDVADTSYIFSDWGGSIVAFNAGKKEDNVIELSPKDGSIIRKMTINAEKLGQTFNLVDHYVLTASLTGRNIEALSDRNDGSYEDFSIENEDMSGSMSMARYQAGSYIVNVEQGTTGGNEADFDTIRFVVYDTNGVKKWTYSDSLYTTCLTGVKYISEDATQLERELLLFVYGNRSKVCDAISGELLDETGYEEEILEYRLGSEGMLEVILANGKVIRHNIGTAYTSLVTDTKAKPKQMKACADKLAVVTKSGAKNVDIYIHKDNSDAIILGNATDITGKNESSVLNALPSKDAKNIYSISRSNDIVSYSIKDKKSHLLYTHDQFVYNIYELKNALCVYDAKSITLIDKKDGSILCDHQPVKNYYYMPKEQELAYYSNSNDFSTNSGYEIQFTDGVNESVYQIGDESLGHIKNIYFSENGKHFAILYEEYIETTNGSRNVHRVQLCDREDETNSHVIELQHDEPSVLNIRFSQDNQRCIVSLNTQSMFKDEVNAPGAIEVFDCESGKNLYTYETEKGMVVDEFVLNEDTYIVCTDYTVEALGEDGQLVKSIVLDEKDNYDDLIDFDKGFNFVVLNDKELLIYNTNRGFIVDIEKNKLRLVAEAESFMGKIRGFIKEENRIVITYPWQVTSYPIYSSNDLYQKAMDLLGTIADK